MRKSYVVLLVLVMWIILASYSLYVLRPQRPALTGLDVDPATGIQLLIQTCNATMPDGTVRMSLPSSDTGCDGVADFLLRVWKREHSMPRHCWEFTIVNHPYCSNSAGVVWPSRDGQCYISDAPKDCPSRGA